MDRVLYELAGYATLALGEFARLAIVSAVGGEEESFTERVERHRALIAERTRRARAGIAAFKAEMAKDGKENFETSGSDNEMRVFKSGNSGKGGDVNVAVTGAAVHSMSTAPACSREKPAAKEQVSGNTSVTLDTVGSSGEEVGRANQDYELYAIARAVQWSLRNLIRAGRYVWHGLTRVENYEYLQRMFVALRDWLQVRRRWTEYWEAREIRVLASMRQAFEIMLMGVPTVLPYSSEIVTRFHALHMWASNTRVINAIVKARCRSSLAGHFSMDELSAEMDRCPHCQRGDLSFKLEIPVGIYFIGNGHGKSTMLDNGVAACDTDWLTSPLRGDDAEDLMRLNVPLITNQMHLLAMYERAATGIYDEMRQRGGWIFRWIINQKSVERAFKATGRELIEMREGQFAADMLPDMAAHIAAQTRCANPEEVRVRVNKWLASGLCLRTVIDDPNLCSAPVIF